MRLRLVYMLVLSFFFGSTVCFAQVRGTESVSSRPAFMLNGQVVDAETDLPIPKVNIEITGKEYATTNNAGEFRIRASVGDELVIKSDAFETVYYTVEDRQRVTVKAVPAKTGNATIKKVARNKNVDFFRVYMDSARYYLKIDAPKSIGFVTQALEAVAAKGASRSQNANAFTTLGDINAQWQQYDLAIANYKRSLDSQNAIDTRLKLAQAYMMNNNYQESIATYEALLQQSLSNYQQVVIYEGLGDVYKAIDDIVNSVSNYQQGLSIAQRYKITPKVTDLNSKIGEAYAQGGAVEEAEDYFDNSLNLANRENKTRAATEKNRVADFYNQNQDFDKEIQLRQETLSELDDIVTASPVTTDASNPLTPQRQNYKIASAYVSQDKYEEAIPFLEKSIEEAEKSSDLVVKKDATRKLSEIYRDIGNFGKAAETYEKYADVVNELYVKKEQELSQAARFSKEMALKQSRIAGLENERELNESRYQLAFENQELIEKNNRVQRWIIGSLIVIALLFLGMAYTQYKSVRQQKYANNLLALKSLRTQMNPHFIFNALNSVNSFIARNDERAANKYLSEFSQLMRSVLENSEEDFIPLSKEIELLRLYVKLEHFRFQDKFDYTIHVDEALAVDQFVIPPMLLQPYVENAVWHGLRYKEEKGNLRILFSQRDAETVAIEIIDDGIGRKKSKALKTEHQKKQQSKGMGNIEKRIAILNRMYQDKVDVTVENVFDNEEGTKVRLLVKKE